MAASAVGRLAFALVLSALLVAPVGATPGDLDPTFGEYGITRTSFTWGGSENTWANAVLQQSDGKIVAGGRGADWNSVFALIRLNTDGSLDGTFGDRGRVLTQVGGFATGGPYGSPYTYVTAVAQQADGKILAAGPAYTEAKGIDLTIARYDTDGNLDHSFGSGGRTIAAVSSGPGTLAALALQEDGKIVAAGSDSALGGGRRITVWRFNTDGSADASFGSAGRATLTLANGPAATALVVQSDGKLAVAGTVGSRALLARFTANGAIDTGFGSVGVVQLPIGNSSDVASAIRQQADGKLIAVGTTTVTPNHTDIFVTRYDPSGVIDSGFATNGLARVSISGKYDQGSAVSLEPDGRILVAGDAGSVNPDTVVLRLDATGILDPTFGNGGIARHESGALELCNAMVRQTDGRIIAVGRTVPELGVEEFGFVRFDANGALDASFGSGGAVTYTAASSDDVARAMIVQRDGKPVIVGETSPPYSLNRSVALARYRPDGRLDPSFGDGGRVITPLGDDAKAMGVVQQANDALVVAADVQTGSVGSFALLRYLDDGSLDPNFGVDGKRIIDVGTSADVYDLLQRDDGKLLLLGHNGTSTLLMRFDPDGNIDASYGTGGQTYAAGGSGTHALVQRDGRVTSADVNQGFLSLVRFHADGGSDLAFGTGGYVSRSISGLLPPASILQQKDSKLVAAAGTALMRTSLTGLVEFTKTSPITQWDIDEQADGKIIAAGYGGSDLALTRFRTDGSVDVNFGTAGKFLVHLGGSGSTATTVRVQPDTRLLVAGTANSDFVLTRHLANDCGDGDLDPDEECDDGGRTSGDGCDENCRFTACGNGIVTAGEECDDGNTADGDGCAANCTLQTAYTQTPTRTPTITRTVTRTYTQTSTRTATRTPTSTATQTATSTSTPTTTLTPTSTTTSTQTPTSTLTSTRTPTTTPTSTATPSPSPTASATPSTTAAETWTPTAAPSATAIPGDTATATPSQVPTPTASATSPPTVTPSPTAADTPTSPPTATSTATPTATPFAGCDATPRNDCGSAAGDTLTLRRGPSDSANTLRWRWRNGSTAADEIGDPLNGSTRYLVCLYDTRAATPSLALEVELMSGQCGSAPCWKRIARGGLSYRDPRGQRGAVTRFVISLRSDGLGTIRLNAKGAGLSFPPSGVSTLLAQEPTVEMQIVNDRGACWGSRFAAPARVSSATRFADRAP